MKHLKSFLCILLCLALLPALAAAAPEQPGDPWGDVLQDNFVRITSADAWNRGAAEGTETVTQVGNGAIGLSSGQTQGQWTSEELTVPAFEYLVASWNADTPGDSSVEIQARAYVDLRGEWTGWMSWGTWGTGLLRSSADTTDELAYVNTDILTIRGSSGETASRIQLRAVLKASSHGESPVLREMCATMKNTLEGQAIPVYCPDYEPELPEKVLLDTPAYSQMRRDSAIGNVICSPTSMTMLLNDRDPALDLFPEEVALRNYDFFYEGFGNWPFVTALAGAYGYSAHCHYADLDFVRHELAQGRSVALSVRYASYNGGRNPYLKNGAAGDTDGHLIVIVGYETIDGVDYFYSNDAAADLDCQSALRLYRADQLDVCWDTRIVYVISSVPEENAGQHAPQRIRAALEPRGDDLYALMVDGQEVALSGDFDRKTTVAGAGTAFVITDNARLDYLPDSLKTTTANREITYLSANDGGQLLVPGAALWEKGARQGEVYIFVNNGPTYIASLTLSDPSAPTESPSAQEPAAPDTAATEAPVAETRDSGGPSAAIPVLLAAAVAVAVPLLVKFRKR